MSNCSLSNQEVNHNIKCNTLNGVFATMAMNLVNPFIGVLAISLGANAYQIALLSSLPAFMSVISMIPGGIMVDKFAQKKLITGIFIIVTRFFFILIALTPQLPANIRVMALVIVFGVMNFPGGISNVAWQSFIATAIPSEKRAHAFATRNKITSICGMCMTLLAGQILRIFSAQVGVTRLYQIFFAAAFGFALLEVYFHLRMKEPVVVKESKVKSVSNKQLNKKNSIIITFNDYMSRIMKFLTSITSNKPFVLFGLCSLLFHFGWQMGWPLFTIYTVDYLGADGTWMSYLSVSGGLAAFITYPYWSKLVTKKGNNYSIILATSAIAMSPFLYAISWNLQVLFVVNFFMGGAVAGISLVLFNTLLEVVPDEDRTLFIAIYSTIISISAIFSPMVGAYVYKSISIYSALVVAGCFRLFGSFTFFLRYKHLKAKGHSKTPSENLSS